MCFSQRNEEMLIIIFVNWQNVDTECISKMYLFIVVNQLMNIISSNLLFRKLTLAAINSRCFNEIYNSTAP